MTGKPEKKPSFYDLEPLLHNTKHMAYLMRLIAEEIIEYLPEYNRPSATIDALLYAAGCVEDCATESLEAWKAAIDANKKTAA